MAHKITYISGEKVWDQIKRIPNWRYMTAMQLSDKLKTLAKSDRSKCNV